LIRGHATALATAIKKWFGEPLILSLTAKGASFCSQNVLRGHDSTNFAAKVIVPKSEHAKNSEDLASPETYRWIKKKCRYDPHLRMDRIVKMATLWLAR
jgi:hypothetical protein